MLKSNRGKSTARKPLIDISNGGKPSRILKKKSPVDGFDGGALDRLLLVRSELSNIFSEIDELVARALENKRTDRKAIQDIESFSKVLRDMHSSLKPWVSRLRQASPKQEPLQIENQLGQQSIGARSVSCVNGEESTPRNRNDAELDLIVSPSPLVSWRADSCTLDTGRQLFLLTPLPKLKATSSKCPVTSKSMVRILHHENQRGQPLTSTLRESASDSLFQEPEAKMPQDNMVKPCTAGTTNSVLESSKDSLFLLTPCLKTFPQKSSALNGFVSENIPELPTQDDDSKVSDDLTNDEVLDGLTSKYQELLGLQPNNNFTNRRKDGNQALEWFLSPPKTCVLMEEPNEEKQVPTPCLNNSILLLATPLWKDVETTIHKGKRAGENTLKKELWARFEEVSKDGLHFDASVFQNTERKGFLDMLEEACETSDCGDGK
ncbi:uncharacterized protein A4U43_C05F26910 [Asparagus officinalis]|uniref:Uncharacterized protein n=1 Tax=Asparagus officinalis TaxID=4686 RepID=A0A5P1EVG0_ASPOF|nr:uncharacterized protein LOC109840637 [Asparagus officinalis]ONK69804.1 uncharacterized protein A4U43_C05F26910 [Asparagus officinalis]